MASGRLFFVAPAAWGLAFFRLAPHEGDLILDDGQQLTVRLVGQNGPGLGDLIKRYRAGEVLLVFPVPDLLYPGVRADGWALPWGAAARHLPGD